MQLFLAYLISGDQNSTPIYRSLVLYTRLNTCGSACTTIKMLIDAQTFTQTFVFERV